MKKISIYVRDESGQITYRGEQLWEGREQVIAYYVLPERGEREDLTGWPHNAVTWHGNVGFGEERKAVMTGAVA